ncbi:MAG: DUF4112 domain-containing protein [Gemmatimonadota bacterium]
MEAPPSHLRSLRIVSRVMDEAVEIPVLRVRVGLDALMGLIPGAGDIAGVAVSGWTVVTAARLGASGTVVARMLLNIAVDALVGAVPVLGDLFDVAFKANSRNLRIMEEHLSEPTRTRRRSRLVVWGAVGGVLALLATLGMLVAWGLETLWRVIAS